MLKYALILLVASTAIIACKPKEDPAAVIPPVPVCNGPSYAYNQPNCTVYNQAVYPIMGCPPGYLPMASTAAGVPGNFCLSQQAFSMVYGPASMFAPLGNSNNFGVPQMCDSYTSNSCGTNTGLRCVAYNGRYGICQ